MPQEGSDSKRERFALFLPHLDVLAHTGRSLLVARELARRGWRVSFAGAGKYERIVWEEGLDVHPLPEMPAVELVRESRRGERWPFHSSSQVRPFVEAEVSLIGALRPDVVVFDHRYTAGTSAEICGVKRVSITNLWWTPYDAIGMGLPETHPLFARAPWLLFLRRFGRAAAAGSWLAARMFARWARPYNEVRAAYDLAPLASILDLFAGDAVILPDSPALMPALDMPAHYHYVGPLVWEPRGELPEEVARMEGYVYVTMGSSADPRVFETAIEALRSGETGAVVTTGGVRRARDFADLPGDVRVYDFLPGSAAAARASVVVCQGGIGTIYQALAAGRPLVGIPFMPEQEVYGIGQVERLHAGVSLSARGLTAERLAERIATVRANPRYAAAARSLSAAVDLHSAAPRAADVVEAF